MIVIWVALGAVVLFALQSALYARYWDRELEVSLEFARESVTEGDTCMLYEKVENRKLLPLPALKIKFQVSRHLAFSTEDRGSSVTDQYYRNDVLSIRPYVRHVRKLSFVCRKRGFYQINGLDLVAGNLFLTAELPKSLTSDARLYVYPRPWSSPEFVQAMQMLNGEILSRRHLLEDPFEYRGIREYSPGDSIRDINWKATARTGDWKVNMKNYTALKALRLFLNLEDGAILRQEGLLEASISMAAGAAACFLAQGIRTGLYSNGPDILTGEAVCLTPASGISHMENVNRALARICLEEKAPSFVQELAEAVLEKKEEQYTVFFSADAREDFQRLLCSCQEKGMGFKWLCPVNPGDSPYILPELRDCVTLVRIEEGR